MTSQTEASKPQEASRPVVSKQIAIRWPEEFWRRAKIAAMDRGCSLNYAATVGAAAFLGIDPPSEAVDVAEET